MFLKTNIFKILTLTLLLSFGAFATYAQGVPQQQAAVDNNFTESDIEKYVKVSSVVNDVQAEAQQKMLALINNQENLDIKKFSEMMQAQQNPQMQVDVTPQQQADFDAIAPKLTELQQQLQNKLMETLEKEGLEPQKFQSIAIAYQQNPKLQQKVDKKMSAQ